MRVIVGEPKRGVPTGLDSFSRAEVNLYRR